MNLFALLSFIAFILFMQAGIFILYKNSQPLINRVFALHSFILALYALSYNLFFSAETLEQVYFYDKVASAGWIFFPIISVWFTILLTKNNSYVIRLICYIFLLPTAIFSFYSVITELETLKLFYNENGNWFYTPYDHTFPYLLFITYLTVAVLVIYFMLIGWYYNADSNRQKMQAKIMLVSLSVFFVLSLITNVILPVVQLDIIPAIAPITALLLTGGKFLALILQPKLFIAPELVYNLIYHHVKEFIFMLDRDFKIFSANQYALNQLNYSIYQLQRKDHHLIFSDYDKITDAIQKMNNRDDTPEIRMELLSSDQNSIPVLLSVIKVKNSFRRVEGYALACTNYSQKLKLREEIAERVRTEKNLYQIRKELEYLVKKRTYELLEANQRLQQEVIERKRAEQQIKADLEQKTELVQEVHHRVKNNIQMIISLINMLCSHHVIDNQTSDHLRDLAEKVRHISRIHEDFYSSPNLSRIAYSPYLKKTIGELYSNYGNSLEIVFKLNIADEFLEINQAIPLGIIFHELLINAMKYAFSEEARPDEKSIIRVEFYKKNGKVTLTVNDNGVGLPPGFNLKNSGNVGLKLVRILTKDHLRGIIESSVNHGTRFKVTFDENLII